MGLKYKYIAIDFDGTIMREDGPPDPHFNLFLPDAVRVMQRINREGGKIMIWTARDRHWWPDMLHVLQLNDVEVEAINGKFVGYGDKYIGDSNKLYAEVYIDDRDIHVKESGIDWLKIERLLFGGNEIEI